MSGLVRQARLLVSLLAFSMAPALSAGDDLAVLRAELRAREEELYKAMRSLAPGPSKEELRQRISRPAVELGVDLQWSDFTPPERLSLANGRPAPIELVRVTVAGREAFGDVAFFLRLLAYSAQRFQIEAMDVRAEKDDTVTFETRIAMPYADETWDGAAASVSRRADIKTVLRERIAEQQALLDLVLGLTLSPNPAEVMAPVAEWMEAARSQAIEVSRLTFSDGAYSMEGEVVGGSARAALRQALEGAQLSNLQIQIGEQGVCRPFTVTAQLLLRDRGKERESEVPELKTVTGNGLFAAPGRWTCAAPPNERATSVRVQGKQRDAITVKLRQAAMSHALSVLSELSGASFILDPDLDTSINLDAEDATIDQIVAGLAGAGLSAGPAPLRRVTRRRLEREETEDYTGEAVTLLFDDADLRSVLCLFSTISGLEFRTPPDLQRRVTIFSREIPWDRALSSILRVHGLRYRIDGTRVLIGPDGPKIEAIQLADACADTSSAEPRRVFQLTELDWSDLDLVAVGRTGDEWRAYTRSPSGHLLPIAAGAEVFGGTVSDVQAAGVIVVSGNGTKRLVAIDR